MLKIFNLKSMFPVTLHNYVRINLVYEVILTLNKNFKTH